MGGHVASTEEIRNVSKILIRILEGTDQSGDFGVNGNILKWILKK